MIKFFPKPSALCLALSLVFSAPALSLLTAGNALAQIGDTELLLAREAWQKKNLAKLDQLAPGLSEHELAPYVESWQLRLEMAQNLTTASEMSTFFQRYEGSYVVERLRNDWLRQLAKQGQWRDFDAEFAKLQAPDPDLVCYGLQSRLNKGDRTALNAALPLWQEQIDSTDACQPLFAALFAEKRLTADDVWTRARRQLETNKANAVRGTLGWLPSSEGVVDSKQLANALGTPASAQIGLNSASRASREVASFAVARIARNDPGNAAVQLESLSSQLQENERQWAWSQIGWQAALRHQPEALEWYARAGNTPLSEDVVQWKVRAALRAKDWTIVHRAIAQMTPALAAIPAWTYWNGRAHKAGGKLQEANALFAKIAGQPNFYGNLADEELGRKIQIPPKAAPLTKEEKDRASKNPGLLRALALFRNDLRTEGVREWNWAIRNMTDRDLLAAADLAQRNNIYDRAINTADKTRNEHDYSLRYLAPYDNEIRPAARNQSLDEGWVYGLMRQESRFITSAKSNVGASGLMQLMPATAKWVAKKIGLTGFTHSQVHDTSTNVLLGTSYMRMVMESLDNNPVLTSAAYNAGPGRARKWKANEALEGAVYAETIPFNETRDYVKKVMSNAVYYSVLFNGRPESLKSRLGVIRAKSGGEVPIDLP